MLISEWVDENLTEEEIADIATYGALGQPGLTYDGEILEIYDLCHRDIWDSLEDDISLAGIDHLEQLEIGLTIQAVERECTRRIQC